MRSSADVEYVEHTITQVREEGDYYSIEAEDGWLSVEKAKFVVAPKVGQRARYFGRGFGFPVRGLAIDGVEIYYETHDEYYHRQRAEQVIAESARKAEADANEAEREARVAALPECFQKRIRRFRANNPSFYYQHEGYEMASCVDAVKIAGSCETVEAVRAFHELSWDEQKARVPDLSEGHSGNTFGMAVRLAHHFLKDERLVFAEHAAISALVGCEEAGCQPVTDAEMVAAGYEPFRED